LRKGSRGKKHKRGMRSDMLEDDSETESRRVSTLKGSILGQEDFLEAE
jgi:hypothetical protein